MGKVPFERVEKKKFDARMFDVFFYFFYEESYFRRRDKSSVLFPVQ